ncbi:MAG: trypsin-like peptidase domain-containing protein [Acidobacteriia bacterium]|nr:trypsin-like peptidase domain-containing protein [Terriglobia bacterium]
MTYEPRAGSFSRHLISFFVVLFVLGLGIGIGTLISRQVVATGPRDSQIKIQSSGTSLASSGVLALSQAFEEVAKRVGPAVVNINTEEVIRLSGRPGQGRNNPQMPDLFGQLFRDQPQEFTQNSLGSGIIVDPKGYIITNNHVVEGATKIKVNVKDGKEYKARVIAGDSTSDIAVIKIDGDVSFPAVTIGDAKAMKVGDWVMAIGSPFGLEQTVTAGIISATGRVFDQSQGPNSSMLFNDYLQTDAAINPGNSGGPLVNMNGEVIGINSFISTSTRSNTGVGFAVPSHIFVDVYNQILDKGKVSRGYLGVLMNVLFPFTPQMAEYYGVKQGGGVLITGLSPEDGPAAKAGIKAEDVIVEFNGKKITDVPALRLAAVNTPPGRTVNVKAVRYGTMMNFSVTLTEKPPDDTQARPGVSFDEKTESKPEIGMRVDNVPSRMAGALEITGGALVVSVSPGSLAEEAGLIGQQDQAGFFDIILAANGKKIEVVQDMLDILKDLKSGQSVVIKLQRVLNQSGRLTKYGVGYTSLVKP